MNNNKEITKETIEQYIGKKVLFGTKMRVEMGKPMSERIVKSVNHNTFNGLTVKIMSPITGAEEYIEEGEEAQGAHLFQNVIISEV